MKRHGWWRAGSFSFFSCSPLGPALFTASACLVTKNTWMPCRMTEPAVVQTGPGRYDVYMRAQIWSFAPNEIKVPAGSTVTFYITTPDVQHGFLIERTNVNLMVLPGQVSKTTARFDEPGEYRFFCHEYCGIAHHTMFGKVVVEPRS